MNELEPLPVRPLEYDVPRAGGPWRRLVRGVGFVLIVLGGAAVIAYGTQIAADLGRWADPFYRRYRMGGAVIGIPPVGVLIGCAIAEMAVGALGAAAGVACLRGWRRARRWTVALALAETAVRVTSAVLWASWMQRSPSGFEPLMQLGVTGLQLMRFLALPWLLLLLARRRELWMDGGGG